ncbi:hypothetical protein A5N15_02005 [Rothia kristinae]|uniref:Alanine racemase C-terminal domain-containing protein n=1 Tax=Rothia kristinae TaxID=37923 RepID=A0A657IW67_9MICC|nr:hypothetical protein A5N15_02005 [Rothia kristinae]
MTLQTFVDSVKEVPAGQGVSYGLRYRTETPTTLALIPVGYADGVPRVAEHGPVRIHPAGRPPGPSGSWGGSRWTRWSWTSASPG